jgi:hypothetical protein
VCAGQFLADAFHFLMLPLAFPAGEFLVFGGPLDGSLAGQPGFQPGEFTRPIRRACGLVPGRFGLASSASERQQSSVTRRGPSRVSW